VCVCVCVCACVCVCMCVGGRKKIGHMKIIEGVSSINGLSITTSYVKVKVEFHSSS